MQDFIGLSFRAGVALMMSPRDNFSHEVAAHLQSQDAGVRVCNWDNVDDHSMLPTVPFIFLFLFCLFYLNCRQTNK